MAYYYRLLGVDRTAGPSEIKKAYHRLARKFHPDTNGGHPLAEQRFRLIAEAYTVLGDDEQRRAYDRFGPTALVRGGNRPGVIGGMERLVSSLGGIVEARLRRAPRRGKDRRTAVTVTLAEACNGVRAFVDVPFRERCGVCNGTRATPGTVAEACHVCNGTGEARRDSVLAASEPCVFCQGQGVVAIRPCVACDGSGEATVSRRVPVDVPPAVEPGRRLVLRGFGENGENGGDVGDLFVEIKIEPHALLVREGWDLLCTIPLTLREAIEGAEVSVPTLSGAPVRVRVPAGVRSGHTLRLRGRGVPRQTGAGDLLLRLELETPVLATREAHAALAELDRTARHPLREAYERELEKP